LQIKEDKSSNKQVLQGRALPKKCKCKLPKNLLNIFNNLCRYFSVSAQALDTSPPTSVRFRCSKGQNEPAALYFCWSRRQCWLDYKLMLWWHIKNKMHYYYYYYYVRKDAGFNTYYNSFHFYT